VVCWNDKLANPVGFSFSALVMFSWYIALLKPALMYLLCLKSPLSAGFLCLRLSVSRIVLVWICIYMRSGTLQNMQFWQLIKQAKVYVTQSLDGQLLLKVKFLSTLQIMCAYVSQNGYRCTVWSLYISPCKAPCHCLSVSLHTSLFL
jgi:hypothetical protein